MQASETGRGLRPPIGDYVLAGSLAVLSLAVIVSAVRMPRPDGWSEAPGLFPLICGLGLLVMAAILGAAAWRGPAGVEVEPAVEGIVPEQPEQAEQPEPVHLGRTVLVAGSVVVYALVLIPLLGYSLSSFIYLFAVIWYFWRGKLLWILLISLGTTVFLSQTFERAFSIILP